ncbi:MULTISPECIES: class I SAM-dependent methyltransferase [unclassified Prosthecochloris]|uniref:class I SAM-dependent methyltransferase n=1 Tax=unclassified Prosthecochloris TaxID=2632826 RepID=UPI00223E67B6|nr:MULTISPECIES: class I SAM-dependent methyltransferase [unclassified Prosthecochloris]UZJ36943.1 class I SAM-dependent methyltransferase [Prosthecochloris sp. SCSIO W1103]UZJ39888.1 class I SAM-dependent methyltransferase [Prosthecochloris sp. SCSIO W1102]
MGINVRIGKERVSLNGVPETLLWPLWNRAAEQKRKDRLIDDPMSADLVERIDYDFEGSFGKPNAGHAIRARVIDDALKLWLQKKPAGTVVSLGEGLDTQFWRVDNGKLCWISVDLPESIEVRKRFLPAEERIETITCSALDDLWIKKMPQGSEVFIVMAGLLMYFKEGEVRDLLYRLAEHFGESQIIFDVIPVWLSRKSLKGMKVTKTYTVPLMPWALNYGDYTWFNDIHPHLRIKRQMTYADPFPERMRPYSYLLPFQWLTNRLASGIVQLEITSPKP